MPVACLILAAGQSVRFGEANKLLAEVNGRTLVRRAVDIALASLCRDVHVVVPPNNVLMDQSLAGLPVTPCINWDYTSGIGSSIAVGVRSLAPDVTGALILPADMPWMRTEVLDKLITAFEGADDALVTFPVTAAGEQRNPVLWPSCYFKELGDLGADRGAKHLIPTEPAKLQKVVFQDDAGFKDVDRPSDLSP